MGGENAPSEHSGLNIFLDKNKSKDIFYFYLYGDKKILNEKLIEYKIDNNKNIEIVHTNSVVSDEETPLTAIKNSKDTSMWNSVKAQTDQKADITLSAGNTGVLFVISKMILK